jgi:DNA-binding Lrp family transcriptional regulator
VRALEQAGFIRGYHAILDARLAGYEITAFASVRLHAQGEPELREFEKQVLMWPLVREIYMLSGDMDYQLTCVAPDLSAFQEQVVGRLAALPNVASVKTTLVMRRVKHDSGVPISVPEA